MERATGTEVYGCGSPQSTDITLNIQTTTGGNFSISLSGQNTVEHLKKLVSKKLKVSKDRICLLHRERQLREGTLEENGLLDGARVILLPSVETGLLTHRPESSVMQALESLNDSQVNDFLSGKSPLNLTMRLGDHMMLIQLQLSTLHSSSSSSSRSIRIPTPTKSSTKSSSDAMESTSTPHKTAANDKTQEDSDKNNEETHILHKKDLEMIQNAFNFCKSMAEENYSEKDDATIDTNETLESTSSGLPNISDASIGNEQSPIKSLSNLVSSPIAATTSDRDVALVKTVKSNLLELLTQSKSKLKTEMLPSTSAISETICPSSALDSSFSDDSDNNFTDQSPFLAENTIDEYPMESLFNSAVDKGLFNDQDETMMDREISNLATTSHGQDSSSGTSQSVHNANEPMKNKRFQYLLHKTSKFNHPIGQNKQKAFMQSVVNKHRKRMQNRQESTSEQSSNSQTESYITNSRKLLLQPSSGEAVDTELPSTSKQIMNRTIEAPRKPLRLLPRPTIDTRALAEASKNLTQKLKKLSKEVLTNKIDLRATEETVRSKIGSGAVIESMKHHGKGIYSGTFSGTLNPALQDKYGRPKRDISTIIHILNDLLCAAPQSITFAQPEAKHICKKKSGETTTCLGCSQPSCTYGDCDGHTASTSLSKPCECDSEECECTRLEPETCLHCAETSSPDGVCPKCATAKALALDNSKTKCKLEQLRLVMQEKKQRREARKLKTLPYTKSPPKTITTPDQPPAVIQEEIETVA